MELHKRADKERFLLFKEKKTDFAREREDWNREKLGAVDDMRAAAITQSCHVHGEFFDRMY